MFVRSNIVLLCVCTFLSSSVVGKTKIKEPSPATGTEQGNNDDLGIQEDYLKRNIRQLSPYYYDESGAQNGYAGVGQYQDTPQNPNGYNPVGQDYDQGYGQPNGQSGIVSGRVRPGEIVSIGNGRGNTNVIAINSGRETDYYYGYSANTGNNDGYGQNPTYPGKKESGIAVNKQPGQDDVVLWNRNGGKQSSIAVNRDGAVLYSGNDYQEPYPYYNRQSTNYNTRKQGYGPGTQHQSSSSIVSSQQQTYLNSHRYH